MEVKNQEWKRFGDSTFRNVASKSFARFSGIVQRKISFSFRQMEEKTNHSEPCTEHSVFLKASLKSSLRGIKFQCIKHLGLYQSLTDVREEKCPTASASSLSVSLCGQC